MSTLSFSQSVLDPGRGQFFEQGYSVHENGYGNEMALDLCADTDLDNLGGIAFIGWYETEAPSKKDLAFYKTNAFGKKLVSSLEKGKLDDIPTGIVADPVQKRYLVCVRKTNQYIESSYEAQGDSLLVYSISYGGQISLLYKQGFEEAGLAPIDIALGPQNTFYVLANKKNTNASVTPVLTKFNYNGSVAWQRTYDNEENSIRAHELLIEPTSEGQAIRFSANNITDVPFPKFIGYSDMGTLLHTTSYTTQLNMYVDGVAKQGSDYLFAATQTVGTDKQAAVFKINSSFAHQTTYTVGKAEGDEGYSDIIVYPTGFSCTGLIDTASSLTDNEGGKDILISQFTPSGEVILHETVGSQEDEQIGRSIQHPLKPALILAGYHKGYGINESGNAYIAASLYEDVRNLMTGTCEVPRSMWVDSMVHRTDDAPFGVILGNTVREDDLIQFASENNINKLLLYGLNFIFDDVGNQYQYIVDRKTQLKDTLATFIEKCQLNNITVGVVVDSTNTVQLSAYNFNIDQYNLGTHAKINYVVLEHEFWNANGLKANSGNTKGVYPIPLSSMNNHFENVWNDHKDAINELNTLDNNSGNIWEVYDYVAYYFHNWGNSISNSYHYTNTDSARAKAIWLDNHTDAIYLYYYQNDQDSLGLDFLKSSNGGDYQAERFIERLKQLGYANEKSIIFPLFSGEYYSSTSDFCGYINGTDNDTTDFLGRYLEGPPANVTGATGTFYSTETEYLNQHTTAYNDIINFPEILDVKVNEMSWFKYSCLEPKNFEIKSRVSCPVFSNVGVEAAVSSRNQIEIFPNPFSNSITLKAVGKVYYTIFSTSAQIVSRGLIENQASINLSELQPGLYFMQIENEGIVVTKKIMKR